MTQRSLARSLGLFQAYRFLSTSYLFAPAIPFFFGARGLSVTEITLLNSVYCVTAMLFEVPTGALADRWGRKRAMVLGSLMMAAGCLADWLGHSFAAFAVGEGLLALGMTLTSGADSAYLYDLLRDAGREHEYRRREGAASAAKLVGAAVALAAGGWLARAHLGATYLATAGVCVVAAAVAALMHEAPYQRPAPRAMAASMAASAREVLGHRPLLFAVVFSTLIFTLVRMGIYLHPLYLSAAGMDLSRVGMTMAILSLAAAWGAWRIDALRRALGERGLVWGLPAALAVSYLVLGRWFAWWGIIAVGLQCVASGVYSPLSKELLNREIADSSHRATILSVESMARRLAFGLYAPLVGAMIDRRALSAGFYTCAALAVAGAAALAVRIARRRRAFSRGFEGEQTPTPAPAPPEVVAAVAASLPDSPR